ncbi:hypothetical protein [Neorhizobium galegae]|uniref:hypothetical protein n=1 Tax=Neorhizobium galegae TaxID=399 RepID=UPI000621C032|nr:hypothetical protein [Neorhizobium galegae]CDZ52295.1 Hypothetical protein NGAL_HAMBI2427_45800 [Neorhizobium galegae bv. orientalis]
MEFRSARREENKSTVALHFVDENLLKIKNVEDRFNARYAVTAGPERKTMIYPRTISETGVRSLNLRSAVNLGFGTTEYIEAIRFEEQHNRPIQSEEELHSIVNEAFRRRFIQSASAKEKDNIPDDIPDYTVERRSLGR